MDMYYISSAFLPTHTSGFITGYLNPLKGKRTTNAAERETQKYAK